MEQALSKPLEEAIQDFKLERLTRLYPIKSVLGEHYSYWKNSLDQLYIIEFFSSSPANSRKVESGILPQLLKEAVRYDKWVTYKTNRPVEEVINNVILYGGMVRSLIHKGYVYYAPTKDFITFVRKRVERLDGINRYHIKEFFGNLRVFKSLH